MNSSPTDSLSERRAVTRQPPVLLRDPAPLSRALSQVETREGWIDAYFERREVEELRVDGEKRDLVRRREAGLAVRLVHDNSWLASRDELTGMAFAEACRQVARVAPRVPIRPPEELVVPWGETFPESNSCGVLEQPGASAALADRTALRSHAEEGSAEETLESFPAALASALAELRVAFRYELKLRRLSTACQVVANVFASEVQRETFYALEVHSERLRWGSLLAELSTATAGDAARRLASQFKARDAAPPAAGRSLVVLAPRAAAVFLHEAVAHALEADLLALSGRPAAARGVTLGSPLLHVLDDPGSAPNEVRRSCDDEGIPTARRWLLRGGMVEQPLADRLWARAEDGLDPGAGWRGDRHSLPQPRTRHLELVAGHESIENLLRLGAGGFFVEALSAGSLDPINGQVRLDVPYLRRIDGAVLGERLGAARLTGNLGDMLCAVGAVGAERRVGGAGWCAKGGQRLPVWATAPAILIESLAISPRQGAVQ